MAHDETPRMALEILQKCNELASNKQPGAREQLLELCYKLETTLEIPDDFIQKVHAEVSF